MSTGAQIVANKLDALIDINKKMLAVLEKGGKGGTPATATAAPKQKINDEDAKKLTGLAGAMKDLVEAAVASDKVKPGSADKLVKFYTVFSDGLKKAMAGMKPKEVESFTEMMKVLSEGSAKFIKAMALTAVLAPFAIIGAKVFTFILKGLLYAISKMTPIKKQILSSLETLMKLGTDIGIFMLVMVGVYLLAKQAVLGTLLFIVIINGLALGLRLADKLAGGETGGSNRFASGPLASLMGLARGLALFMLTMVGIYLLAKQVFLGTLVFIGTILVLSVALRAVDAIAGGGLSPTDEGPLGALSKLGMSIALFVLTMVAVNYVAPQFIMGTLIVVLTLSAFMIVLGALSKALKTGGKPLGGATEAAKGFSLINITNTTDQGPLGDVLKLAKAIAIFSVTMIVVGYLAAPFALGALVVLLALTALGGVMFIYNSDKVKNGAKNVGWVTLALAGFLVVLGLYAIKVAPHLTWDGLAMLGAAVVGAGLAFFIVGKLGEEKVKEGAKAMMYVAGALILFSAALVIYAQGAAEKLSWEKLGMLAAAIGGAALIATLLGLGPLPLYAAFGAAALAAISVALILFSTALVIYAQAADKLDEDKLNLLAGAITTISLIATVLGIPPISLFAFAGAAALVVLGLALRPLSEGLATFAKSGFNKDNGDSLKHALHSIILGMFGYEKLEDIGIGAAVWIPSLIGFLTGTASAFVEVAKALVPLSHALFIFKMTKWEFIDSINLKLTLKAIADAFADIADGDRWKLTMKGIFGMRDVGGTLISLAAGIQAMANMTFTEYEWDETTKKLEPKKKVKLTPVDVKNAGDNAAYVISVLAEPLAKFGAFVDGKAVFFAGPGQMISGNFESVLKGVITLNYLGNSLTSLATGVRDWANMAYWEWGLMYNPQTGMKELRPIKKEKLEKTDIEEAVSNISNTISSLLIPLSSLGDVMQGSTDKSGYYAKKGLAKNGIERGIEALSGVGTILVNLATGVRDWAGMAYWEYDLVYNPKTGMKEIRPVKKSKITPLEQMLAGVAITDVITTLIDPIYQWGLLMSGAEITDPKSPYKRKGMYNAAKRIQQGIDALGQVSSIIQNLATGVKSFAVMEVIEYAVQKDPKTGLNTLVPKGVKKIDEAMMTTAKTNIKDMIGFMAEAIIKFKEDVDKKGGFAVFEPTLNFVKKTYAALGELAMGLIRLFADGKRLEIVVGNFDFFVNGIFKKHSTPENLVSFASYLVLMSTQIRHLNNLSASYKKMNLTISPALLMKYGAFMKITERLAKIATPFEKFVKSFGDMAKHMGVFSANFKVMDAKGIMAFKDWTDSMVELSKVDITKSGGIIGFINDTVSSAFGMGGSKEVEAGKKPQEYTESDKRRQVEAQMAKEPASTTATASSEPKLDVSSIADAIRDSLNQYLSNMTIDNMTVLNWGKKD